MAKMLPVPVTALPRVQDRMSFLYLVSCVVSLFLVGIW